MAVHTCSTLIKFHLGRHGMIVSIAFLMEGSLLNKVAVRRFFKPVSEWEVMILVSLTAAMLSATTRRLVTELSTILGGTGEM